MLPCEDPDLKPLLAVDKRKAIISVVFPKEIDLRSRDHTTLWKMWWVCRK